MNNSVITTDRFLDITTDETYLKAMLEAKIKYED